MNNNKIALKMEENFLCEITKITQSNKARLGNIFELNLTHRRQHMIDGRRQNNNKYLIIINNVSFTRYFPT